MPAPWNALEGMTIAEEESLAVIPTFLPHTSPLTLSSFPSLKYEYSDTTYPFDSFNFTPIVMEFLY